MSNPRKHFLVATIVAGLGLGLAAGFYTSTPCGQQQNSQVLTMPFDIDDNIITLEGEEAEDFVNLILGEGGLIDEDATVVRATLRYGRPAGAQLQ